MPPAIEAAYRSPIAGALGAFLLVCAFGLLAYGVGAWVLKVTRGTWRGPREGHVCVGLAIGLAVLSCAGFVLAWARVLTPAAAWALMAACVWPAVHGLRHARASLAQQPADALPRAAWPRAIIGVLIGLHLLFEVLFRAMPPTDVDGAVYQLALPRRYAEAGGLVPIPDNIHSYKRSYATFLYTLGWSLGDIRFACFLSVLWVIGLYFGVAALGRWLARPNGPAWTLAVWFSMPLIWILVTIVGNDTAVMFFALAAFLLLEEARDAPDLPSRLRVPCLLGTALGFPAAVKLSGLFFAAPVGLSVLLPWRRVPGRSNLEKIRFATAFIVCGAVPLLPFLVLNRLEAGNPFAPYAGSAGSGVPLPPGEFSTRAHENLPFLLALPERLWAIWLTGLHVGPLLLAAAPLAFRGGIAKGPVFTAWICGWVGMVGLLWSVGVDSLANERYFSTSRYLLPSLVILCLPLAGILDHATQGSRWRRALAVAALAFPTFWGAAAVAHTTRHMLPVLTGSLTARDYVRTMSMDFDAVEFINTHLPSDACVLSVTRHSLYLDRRHIVSSSYNHPYFNFDGFKTADEFLRKARSLGITHLLMPPGDEDPSPYGRYGPYARFRLRNPSFPDVCADRLWSGKWADVYALRDQPR